LLDSSGEAGQGSTQYYLASAFDKIFLQPSGLVGLIGVSMQSLFFKDFLAKIGVQAQIFNYHEYKNAGNMFTESSYTDAHREQSQRLTDGMFELVCCRQFFTRLFGNSNHPSLLMPLLSKISAYPASVL
jgi:protease-4